MPTVAKTGFGARIRRSLWGGGSAAVSTAGATEGLAERYGGRSVNQAIEVITGHINTAQIIKFAIIAFIILALGIFFVNVLRGFAIGLEQMGCGIGNANPFSGKSDCDPSSPTTSLTWSLYAFWEAEWYMRCLSYLCLAVIIGLLIYQWAGWLMNKLLRADQDAERLKNWIYGSSWFERGSDEGLETRL
jgi:hypothetical protein